MNRYISEKFLSRASIISDNKSRNIETISFMESQSNPFIHVPILGKIASEEKMRLLELPPSQFKRFSIFNRWHPGSVFTSCSQIFLKSVSLTFDIMSSPGVSQMISEAPELEICQREMNNISNKFSFMGLKILCNHLS